MSDFIKPTKEQADLAGLALCQARGRRVVALEAAQNDTTQTLRWVVAKLGRISAVQEEHGLRLDRIETDLSGLRREFSAFRQELPGIVAETMRDVLRRERS